MSNLAHVYSDIIYNDIIANIVGSHPTVRLRADRAGLSMLNAKGLWLYFQTHTWKKLEPDL